MFQSRVVITRRPHVSLRYMKKDGQWSLVVQNISQDFASRLGDLPRFDPTVSDRPFREHIEAILAMCKQLGLRTRYYWEERTETVIFDLHDRTESKSIIEGDSNGHLLPVTFERMAEVMRLVTSPEAKLSAFKP